VLLWRHRTTHANPQLLLQAIFLHHALLECHGNPIMYFHQTASLECGSVRRKEFLARLTNFWWDIENHVMLSFEDDFMARLPGVLKKSWDKMNTQAIQRAASGAHSASASAETSGSVSAAGASSSAELHQRSL
jgi:hypothetical protein